MGLLMVTMEPPPAMEEEFNDWYDLEHIPERQGLPGFRNATRWVCLHGWPRYLALYDLDSPATMHRPEYLAVSADNVSPWSHRVLPRTRGRVRIVAEQVAPGTAELVPSAGVATLVVARYAQAPVAAPAIRGLVQSRCFRQVEGGAATWVLAAFDRVVPIAALQDAFDALGGAGALAVNGYVPYVR